MYSPSISKFTMSFMPIKCISLFTNDTIKKTLLVVASRTRIIHSGCIFRRWGIYCMSSLTSSTWNNNKIVIIFMLSTLHRHFLVIFYANKPFLYDFQNRDNNIKYIQ